MVQWIAILIIGVALMGHNERMGRIEKDRAELVNNQLKFINAAMTAQETYGDRLVIHDNQIAILKSMIDKLREQ